MRKLVVLSFITLDNVMQAPGGPEEDPTGGFRHGGWVAGYFDDFLGKVMVRQMSRPFDLLLGRKTYEIFAAHWPYAKTDEDPIAAGINKAKKYIASKTMITPDWRNSELIKGDVAKEVKKLKEQDGPEIQVHGSGNLIQTLLKHDLVDELWLKIFPITLGRGKRLFAEGTIPAAFKLLESEISPSGVLVANYVRAGEVRTGSFAPEVPSEAELARRKRLKEEEQNMKPRITVLTIGVDDLQKSLKFYRDGLGLKTEGIVGEEFEYGAVAFIDLENGMKLALWPRESLARDAGVAETPASATELSIGHNVSSQKEVDQVMAQAEKAGARIIKPAQKTFWGGYAGYFQDPDGHLWEIIWNPAWEIGE